jgi:hypothetical protein
MRQDSAHWPGREHTRFGRRGLHDQVVDALGLRVMREEFGDEGLLPTEPELGPSLGVSCNALRKTIKVLVGKGLLEVALRRGCASDRSLNGICWIVPSWIGTSRAGCAPGTPPTWSSFA